MAAAHAVTNDNDDHLSSDQRMMAAATTHHQQQQRSHDDSVPNTSTLHVVHTDAVVVHDEENDNTGHGVSSWSQTDGPRRTMRKVSRRVLPLAAAAYGISQVRRECITYIHILRMVLLHVVRTALSCVLTEIVELTESRLCVFVSGRRSG